MFYVFLLIIAALGVGLYLMFFLQNVPGAVEERLGVLEPLPEDLGTWKAVQSSEAARSASLLGQVREERVFFDEARGKLLAQVRFRSSETGEIVRALPDTVIKRRRTRSR